MKDIVPEPINIRSQCFEPVVVDSIQAPRTLGPVNDQTCIFQDPQMLRHRRLRDGEFPRDRSDVAFAVGQKLKDLSPGRIAQSVEHECFISHD